MQIINAGVEVMSYIYLFCIGEGKSGTKTEVFNKILAHESYDQLSLIFEKYKAVSGHTIEQALNAEVSGELKDAMLALGTNTIRFFNQRKLKKKFAHDYFVIL